MTPAAMMPSTPMQIHFSLLERDRLAPQLGQELAFIEICLPQVLHAVHKFFDFIRPPIDTFDL